MKEGTTGQADVVQLRQGISMLLRRRVLEAVEAVLEEELAQALGTGRYERSEERCGYRNGHETRRITTEVGPLARTKSAYAARSACDRGRHVVGA
jgi:putative transposase